jgi:hypothetical protein
LKLHLFFAPLHPTMPEAMVVLLLNTTAFLIALQGKRQGWDFLRNLSHYHYKSMTLTEFALAKVSEPATVSLLSIHGVGVGKEQMKTCKAGR